MSELKWRPITDFETLCWACYVDGETYVVREPTGPVEGAKGEWRLPRDRDELMQSFRGECYW